MKARHLINAVYVTAAVFAADAALHIATGQGFLWNPDTGAGNPPMAFWRCLFVAPFAAIAAGIDERWTL